MEDLGEAHGVRRREPPRRLCITRWRVDVVVEDMARHTLYVDEPQVLLYLDDVKITPSNPCKAKPRAAPDTSSEAPDAGVRPGIEFLLESVIAIWTRWRN